MAEETKEKGDSERYDATDDNADNISKNEASTDIVCDVVNTPLFNYVPEPPKITT